MRRGDCIFLSRPRRTTHAGFWYSIPGKQGGEDPTELLPGLPVASGKPEYRNGRFHHDYHVTGVMVSPENATIQYPRAHHINLIQLLTTFLRAGKDR